MRRLLTILLALVLFAPAALAEAAPSFDLDAMTPDELLALHSAVTTRVAVVNSGDVVYDEDGITIVWNGLVDTEWSNFKFGCTIYNQTGENVWFRITGGGVNGIQMGPGSNNAYMEIIDGMALYTGGNNCWLVDNMLQDLNITHASEIYLQVSFYVDNDWRTEPFRVVNVRFPVDEEIVLE